MKGEQKTMWTAPGKWMRKDDDFLYHQIPTAKGQSGGPVLQKKGKNYYIIGIHIMGNEKNKENLCIRLNNNVLKKINEWIGCEKEELNLSKSTVTKVTKCWMMPK